MDWPTLIFTGIAAIGGLSGVAALITAIATAKTSDANTKNTVHKDEMESLRGTIATLQAENRRLSDRTQELSDCIDRYEEESKEKETASQARTDAINNLKKENLSLNSTIREMEHRILGIEKEGKAKDSVIEGQADEIAALRGQVKKLSKELDMWVEGILRRKTGPLQPPEEKT